MKRSTKMMWIGVVFSAILGWLLVRADIRADTLLFWGLLGVFLAYGIARYEQGYNRCKEGLIQETCDNIRKDAEEILGNAKPVLAELDITGR